MLNNVTVASEFRLTHRATNSIWSESSPPFDTKHSPALLIDTSLLGVLDPDSLSARHVQSQYPIFPFAFALMLRHMNLHDALRSRALGVKVHVHMFRSCLISLKSRRDRSIPIPPIPCRLAVCLDILP